MKDFFEGVETRPGGPWPAFRRDLHWHLLPPDSEQASTTLVGPYTDLVDRPGLHMVPPEWLHVTVLHAGPRTEATAEEIARITDRVREAVAGTGPVTLTFSRPAVGATGIGRDARPGKAARRLWEATWDATVAVVGERWNLVPKTYTPHVTIAYAGRDADRADRAHLTSILSDIDAGEVTMTFPALTLVSQWHTHENIVWEPLATIPLGPHTEVTA